jgi:hypothetical protein
LNDRQRLNDSLGEPFDRASLRLACTPGQSQGKEAED